MFIVSQSVELGTDVGDETASKVRSERCDEAADEPDNVVASE